MKKSRQIIGGVQQDEMEITHYDVPGSECSDNGVDCVFMPEPQCTNCGGTNGDEDVED